MKRYLFLTAVLFFFTSCKKDLAAGIRTQMAGQWEYVTFSGYPFSNNSLPPGNSRIIVFSNSGSFERRQHDTVVYRGNYQLEQRKDCVGDAQQVFLTTSDPNFVSGYYINFYEGQLYISSSNCLQDGGSSIWRKL